VAADGTRRSARGKSQKNREPESPDRGIQGVPLKPIRMVERQLTRPDGTQVTVQVPVYPPFRLPEQPPGKPEPGLRKTAPKRDAPAKRKKAS
jgi:hypothetical protein